MCCRGPAVGLSWTQAACVREEEAGAKVCPKVKASTRAAEASPSATACRAAHPSLRHLYQACMCQTFYTKKRREGGKACRQGSVCPGLQCPLHLGTAGQAALRSAGLPGLQAWAIRASQSQTQQQPLQIVRQGLHGWDHRRFRHNNTGTWMAAPSDYSPHRMQVAGWVSHMCTHSGQATAAHQASNAWFISERQCTCSQSNAGCWQIWCEGPGS